MNERRNELSEYRLKDSINRSYYSVFYAVKSVLAVEGVDFKRHKDAIGYFNQHYVATEIFPRELGRMDSSRETIAFLEKAVVNILFCKEKDEEGNRTRRRSDARNVYCRCPRRFHGERN